MMIISIEPLVKRKMIFLRNKKFWALVFILGLFVMMFSGCGGTLQDDETSSDTDTTDDSESTATDTETYSIAEILDGSWAVIDDEVSTTLSYNDSDDVELQMISVRMLFSSTTTSGNTGTSSVTSHQRWRAFLDSDNVRTRLDDVYLDVDDAIMTMTRAEGSKWRCVLHDADNTVMIIDVTSPTTIQVTQMGAANIYANYSMDYSITFTMRKQN